MTDTINAQDILDQVETVLMAERQLLVSGQAHRLAEMSQEKIAAMNAFDGLLQNGIDYLREVPIRHQIEGIVGMARENAIHFLAVQNGLQSILTRVGNASQESYVGAYQSNGGQTPFTHATGGYSRKA
ncbi:hypothetical protein [Hyphomonas pacifica]|uniref:Flagellar protein FlgN n=1 Tax=Hyphomonas pacifica TaxID=1280941 RepID=A0A062U7T1_9PROT|nr:hypothetical protein [Hyphomonas pacifica]KCZ52190.1 hypothetical protein HY2_09240 [Hyphomonas pacifica]RAN35044.1 hypothetical protein HY3_09370 [Hyphomonas pacifica]RAN37505.1 hypothetical protein HY11_08445 [Hyphomonas pacifica]